ncbi:GntP family permease [Maribacter cobaltidurans]|uniref:Gluconate transporter n=1 Tax=Maribacter cobaltidurans TaxID=1178778 RepID=A0A223V4F3_9FLAO|nr:gluconate:H+ symporter [Maribacter cobaltidurans]ASV30294.1 gluconate transporter [Maribacter cobaltidurans]GGD77380.1 gluconate transporter [Maribacter cobaltidurans]
MVLIYLLLAIVAIIFLTTRLKVHAFMALLIVSLAYGLFSGMSYGDIITSINDGFGGTLGKIGLIIVLGVIIGAFLENTGGAFAIAEKVLKFIGKKRIITAMGVLGYIVSIPVFADSGFLLLHPLSKSLSKKAKISIAGPAIALGLGLMASHTMVPPTPGPIAAAGILGADLGLVIAFGFPVSIIALIAGLVFASKYASKTYIEPELIGGSDSERIYKEQPSALKSSIPIIIPILLIVLRSILNPERTGIDNGFVDFLNFVGEPVIALLIGVFLCLLLPKKLEYDMVSSSGWIGKAIMDAASIILITGAGGIFGKILQNSGIAETLGDLLSGYNLGIFLPFVIAAAIKSAQGSSTVALVTSASIIFPMMTSLGFETEIQKALVVIVIGAGSAVVSHANDSFFWVVTQMSGMNVKNGYRLFSLGSGILGFTGALAVFVLYTLFA